jgi:hypothetical protein
MRILEDVTDDLISLSRGDIKTLQEATSRFVSALKQDRAERDAEVLLSRGTITGRPAVNP